MEGAVYLEDLETPRGFTKKDDKDEPTTSQPATVPVASGTQLKRQRTLMDMFSGPKGKTSDPPSKKLKLSASTRSNKTVSGVVAVNSLKRTGSQTLNSIPFSLSSFQASLTDEEKELLKLECEVMGKSW
jgi:uracil-DNA glycosylase